jgi:hypothetical protein
MLDRDPLLSTDLKRDTFQGLVNIGAIIMITAVIQLCIYNYHHRGFLVDVKLGEERSLSKKKKRSLLNFFSILYA